jgi:hypothetical protein
VVAGGEIRSLVAFFQHSGLSLRNYRILRETIIT